jgi:RimJ/RimL family protein N-acetyltransferase
VQTSVRRLGGADVAAYRAIRLDALREAPEAFGSDYESASEQPDSYFADALGRLAVFGGFDGADRLVGLIAFARYDGAKYQHRGDMISVYVRPEARGTGLGMALIEALFEHARHHVLQVHCGVATDNARAIALYRRAGFAVYGTEPRSLFVNGRFIDEHLMVRFLDQPVQPQGTQERS